MGSEAWALSPRHARLVREALARRVPDREVWVFGSRVGAGAKPYSDLDLVVLGERPLPGETRVALKDDFDESDLPFQVDVVEWAKASGRFRQAILARHAVLKPPPSAPARS